MQGTFIGVLMSATLPARLGEPSRALIVARRLGRARETLPVVLGTMVSQTLLNLLALALLGAVDALERRASSTGTTARCADRARAAGAAARACSLAPALVSRPRRSRARAPAGAAGRRCAARSRACATACACSAHAAPAALATVAPARPLGRCSGCRCWLLLMALGLDARAGVAAAAAVLFAVNVTAVVPATPANVGVFQAACVAVLAGAYHVSTPEAIAYGIVLQAVEVATALLMGLPALVNEGLSWREVRLRTMHAAPVSSRRCPRRGTRGARGRGAARVARQARAAGIRAGGGVSHGDVRRLGLHPALRATARSTRAGAPTSSAAWPATARARPAATRPAGCRSSWRWRCRCPTAARRCARRRGSSASTAREKLALIAAHAAQAVRRQPSGA